MKAMKLHLLSAVAGLVATCAIATAAPAALAAPEHDHGAAHAGAGLTLDHGRKWATDEPLRAGMGRIRALLAPQLAAAHGGKLTPAQYAALATQVETEVAGIVANCKLEPKADAMLHKVIGEIGAGTDTMAGKAAQHRPVQGLMQVATAVNNYGRYFDHPGYKPLPVGH